MVPLYLSSVHSEQTAFAACCIDTGEVTQRANIRENKFVVASVVGSTPTQDNTNQQNLMIANTTSKSSQH